MSEDKTKDQGKVKTLPEDAPRPEPLTTDAPKETPKGTTEVTNYEYGDLAIKCGICGHEQIIDTNVKGGITIVLPTTKEHKLQLMCEECKKSDMSIYFLEAANPPVEEVEVVGESDIKPEDVKLTVVKDESEDEPKKESK